MTLVLRALGAALVLCAYRFGVAPDFADLAARDVVTAWLGWIMFAGISAPAGVLLALHAHRVTAA